MNLNIYKYQNHSTVDLQVAIRTIKVEFEDEKRKARDALDSRIISLFEDVPDTANLYNTSLKAGSVIKVKAKVKDYLDKTIPNSIFSLERLLKKQGYTPEDKMRVAQLEMNALAIHDTIDSLYQLSISEGHFSRKNQADQGPTFKMPMSA